jgi:Ca2+-binding RTX toxin-like protein
MPLKNTILAGNGAPGSSQCQGTGTLASAGNNLRGNTSCAFVAAAGDLTANDPLLGPLTTNGGPTQTRALLPGSLALDHGAGCPSLDQRGTVRPQGSACDIGAFELEVPKCKGLFATIVGTTGNERLFGTPGNDVIVGLEGKDKLFGLKGDDVVCGGAGNDKLSGGPGKDKLFGEGGKDKLKGGPGKDKLSGGPGKDKLDQ